MKRICMIVGIVLEFSSVGKVYCGLSSGSVQRPKTFVKEDLMLSDREIGTFIEEALKIVYENQKMSPFAYFQLRTLIPEIKRQWYDSVPTEFKGRCVRLGDLIVKVNKLKIKYGEGHCSNVEKSKLTIQVTSLKNILSRLARDCESIDSSGSDMSPNKDSKSRQSRDFENELSPQWSMVTTSRRISSMDDIFEIEL